MTNGEQQEHSAGIWRALAQRSAERPATSRAVYRRLSRRLATRPAGESSSARLWEGLARRVDFAQYRPRRIADVAEETVHEAGQSFSVLRSPAGSYLRLTPAERELWLLMDGNQTVAGLATIGFLRFKQLLPVAGLVQTLRGQGFLADAPVGIYQQLRRQQQQRTVEGWGQRLLATLRGKTFAVAGIDGAISTIYRWGGWLLFTWPALILLGLIVLAGLASFILVSRSEAGGAYAVLDPDNVVVGLLALWGALLLSFVLHELAHALTVKHFGRRVLRGGVMLYYGMPAAFVDTSDIWLAGQRARIGVSLAGPICDLAVGSLGALAALLLPAGDLGGAAYKLAVACYLAALLNCNPLLELDGYYILVDWMRLPNLRARALAFIGGPLWQKLRAEALELRKTSRPEPGAAWLRQLLAALSHEERVFALYGMFSAAYTALAVVLAALFWQEQLVGVLGDLWAGGPAGRMLALLIAAVVIAPLGLGLIFAAWAVVRAAAAWVARRGYGRSPLIVAATLSLFALALAGLPLRYGLTIETALIAPLLWLVALAAQLSLHTDYRGAAVARALDSFLVVSVLELCSLAGYLLLPGQGQLWAILGIVGFSLLMFAGFVALLDVDLRQSRPSVLAISALLQALAFTAGGLAIGVIQATQPGAPFVWAVISATPIYAGATALAMLLPLLVGMRDSRLIWSWGLLWLGVAAQMVSYLLERLPDWRNSPPALAMLVLAAGMWAAAWCSHYVALRQVSVRDLSWPLQPALGEGQRLQRAFQHSYAALYRMTHAHYGSQRSQALDDRMDVLAATANWEITLDREQARIGAGLAAAPLNAQGERYAEVLRYAVATIEGLAGATFARRAIQAAYDALPWPEREAADQRCFPNTPWAYELSKAFGDAREARLRLLRQVEVFDACSDDELQTIAAALEQQHVAAGQVLLAEEARPRGLWIVEAGEVAVKRGDTLEEELHRGECFGEVGNRVAGRLYRTTVDSDLLYLPPDELKRMLREAAPHTGEGVALLETRRRLEQVPLLHHLPRVTLLALARTAERRRLPERSFIVRQGQPSGFFYVIVAGRAAVVQRATDDTANGAAPGATDPPDQKPRLVAQLGPAEFFGELELLHRTPPMASVIAITPIELIAIPHSSLTGLLTGAQRFASGLERVGSGRMRDLVRG